VLRKNTSAVRAVLKINYAVKEIINPEMRKIYKDTDYQVKQVVGIDTSSLMVAKTGIRGSNDLVWVSRAANYAAKLCSLKSRPTFITHSVYNNMHDEVKLSSGTNMWEERLWTDMNNFRIHQSSYYWKYSLRLRCVYLIFAVQ
jgi:class 3 adenylate cyclase